MKRMCVLCGSRNTDYEIVYEDGGGDYGDEVVENYMIHCAECGETTFEPVVYDWEEFDDLDN